MVETIVAAAIGSALVQHNYTNDFNKVNEKLKDISNKLDGGVNELKSAILTIGDSVTNKLNRLEIMQFLQLVQAPTVDGMITYTYPSGRKLCYEPVSQSILEYLEDGQLAFKNGEAQPVVTERFTENGVEFKVVKHGSKEYFLSDELGFKGTKCLSSKFIPKGIIDLYKCKSVGNSKIAEDLVNAIKSEYKRLTKKCIIRRWLNKNKINILKALFAELLKTSKRLKTCSTLWMSYADDYEEFSQKFPKACAMVGRFHAMPMCTVPYEDDRYNKCYPDIEYYALIKEMNPSLWCVGGSINRYIWAYIDNTIETDIENKWHMIGNFHVSTKFTEDNSIIFDFGNHVSFKVANPYKEA